MIEIQTKQESEAIVEMKEYQLRGIEAKKEMYRQVMEAYRCAHKLDEDGMRKHLNLARKAVSDNANDSLDFVLELQEEDLRELDNDGLADFEEATKAMEEYMKENGTANLILGRYITACRNIFNRRNKEREKILSDAMDAASEGQIRPMDDFVEEANACKPLIYEEKVDLRYLLLKGLRERNEERAKREKVRILYMGRLVAVGA
jgi:hypothetical protein